MSYGYYIGLMSGTSADAMDAVLLEIQPETMHTLAQTEVPYSATERAKLRDAAVSPTLNVNDIMELDRFIATRSVDAVQNLLRDNQLTAGDIQAIGSHGHTLRHRVDPSVCSWQIGDPNWIAEHTGITCVADFRRRDIAAGGQGAPLVPAFHRQLFADTADRMVLNIGGIANLTVLGERSTSGFDTGPGNALIDEYCQSRLGMAYDSNGEIARQGRVQNELLQQWLSHPFFTQTPPRSTGREVFSLALAGADLETLTSADALATLSALTVQSIATAISLYGHANGDLLVCGGGANNQWLLEQLQQALPSHAVSSIADHGIHPQWVEGAAFGWLAYRTLSGLSGNAPAATGAESERILGGIFPGGMAKDRLTNQNQA